MSLTFRNPAALGLDANVVEDAWISIVDGAERQEYGGAVALVGVGNDVVLYRSTGWAVREPVEQRSPMGVDCIFDVASLTKVTATTPVILQLVANGRIGLDQPVGEILPEFGCDGLKAGVTIRRLLTHSAGFRDWIPVFVDGVGEEFYLAEFARSQPEWEPGIRVLYSDPSFITLGAVVRRVTGETIDKVASRTVFEPLEMPDTMFTPPRSLRGRIVGTEIGNRLEVGKAEGTSPVDGGWREGLIRGEVHDGNAWYGFGGVAGHAGLFSTAHDLFRYGRMWLQGGELDGVRVLPEELVAEAITNQTPFGDSSDERGLGWRLLPPAGTPEGNPDSGRGMGDRAFGHTGFTGVSLWMDPDLDLTVVLLTNRVHPSVTNDYMETRARFNAAIVSAMPVAVTP